MSRFVFMLSGFASAVFFAGCAITTNSSTQEVALTTSNGRSVVVDIDGKKIKIPAKVKISRSKGTVVIVRSEDNPDYETTQFVINGTNKITSLFWLNILFPGVWATDSGSGGMYLYTNPSFTVPVVTNGKTR